MHAQGHMSNSTEEPRMVPHPHPKAQAAFPKIICLLHILVLCVCLCIYFLTYQTFNFYF